ncbi:unnamed protein product [Ectocarpus sp. 12 AP-2014]
MPPAPFFRKRLEDGYRSDDRALRITLHVLLYFGYHRLRSLHACEPRSSRSHLRASDQDVDERYAPNETVKTTDCIEIESVPCDDRFNLPPPGSPSLNIRLGHQTTYWCVDDTLEQVGFQAAVNSMVRDPVLEEAFYRGVVFDRLLTTGGAAITIGDIVEAAAASSILFGGIHLLNAHTPRRCTVIMARLPADRPSDGGGLRVLPSLLPRGRQASADNSPSRREQHCRIILSTTLRQRHDASSGGDSSQSVSNSFNGHRVNFKFSCVATDGRSQHEWDLPHHKRQQTVEPSRSACNGQPVPPA